MKSVADWSWVRAALLLLTAVLTGGVAAAERELDEFDRYVLELDLIPDDRPVADEIEHPTWFKVSFLDLKDDLDEARAAGKRGIAIYFGQANCAYCKALMEVNLSTPDIVRYMRKHFDVIAIDIWGGALVTDLAGETLSERAFSIREQTNFTPSFLFIDVDGTAALRLRGYYPPYTFRAALEYVVEGYYREESLKSYIARADPPWKFEVEEMNSQPFFARPPHVLDRSHFPAQRPLVVFFEQRNCHACDILHTEPLGDQQTLELLHEFDAVQLDVTADTPVVTPAGERLRASEWAEKLGLFYTPALLFFDEHGREVVRLDSVARLYRLRGVLQYVLSRAYEEYPTYLEYRFNRSDAF